MKSVLTTQLTAGQVLAKAVVSKNGSILLESGTALNDRYIEQLKKLNIREVLINDQAAAVSYPIRKSADIIDLPLFESQIAENEITRSHVSNALLGLGKSDHLLKHSRNPNLCIKFNASFESIAQELLASSFIMECLTKLYVKDQYLFRHTLNVAVLSGMIGMAQNYSYSQLQELLIGALLFDIGMIYIQESLVKKTTALTSEEKGVINKHTHYGYRILKNHKDIPEASALCALQHHERHNGTGYPLQLKGEKIHQFAQIIAIADVYDALTSPRHYRIPYTSNEAAEYLLASGDFFFQLELVQFFFHTIAIYPVASKVVLNTGQIGVVKDSTSSLGHRPIVKIIMEADGSPALWPYEVDLVKEINLVITRSM